MAPKSSFHRVHCADYLDKHRRRIPQKRNFRSVKDLDISALKRLLGPDNFKKVSEDDYLCQHCFMQFTKEISLQTSEPDADIFVTAEEAVEHLNLGVLLPEVSPLKPPSAVRKRDRPAYAKRKQRELEQAVTKKCARACAPHITRRLPLAQQRKSASPAPSSTTTFDKLLHLVHPPGSVASCSCCCRHPSRRTKYKRSFRKLPCT